jgi:predicted nucleic acid-binding Zn ribbon protein
VSRAPGLPAMPGARRRAHRGAPRRVALAVEGLAERLEPTTALARVQAQWPRVVTALPVAAEGEPCGLRDGVLTLRCSASVYAQELYLLGEDLIAAINGALGEPAVQTLRVRSG